MSAAKVYIEPTEDIVFACDKIAHAASRKVVVLVPVGSNIVSSQVSLKLLNRMLTRTDKIVVLVTEDELGHKFAKRAGVETVSKIADITPEVWERANSLKKETLDAKSAKKAELLAARTADSYEIVETPEAEEKIEEKEDNSEKVELIIDNNEDIPASVEPEVAPLSVDTPQAVTLPEAAPQPVEVEVKEPEFKPMFTKLEPKLLDLGTYAIVSGGDIATAGLGEELKAKLNFLNGYHNNKKAAKHNVEIPRDGIGFSRQTDNADTDAVAELSAIIKPTPSNAQAMFGGLVNKFKELQEKRKQHNQAKEAAAEASLAAEREFAPEPIAPESIAEDSELDIQESESLLKPASSHVATAAVDLKNINAYRNTSAQLTNRNFVQTDKVHHTFKKPPAVRNPIKTRGEKQGPKLAINKSELLQKISPLLTGVNNYWQKLGKNRSRAVIAIIVGALTLLLLPAILFPSAQIKLTMEQKTIPISENITAVEGQQGIDLVQMTLPLRPIIKSDSRSETVNATGQGESGTKAKGSVSILNQSSSITAVVSFPAGTILTRGSLEYATLSAVTIEPGKQVEVQVEATGFGEQYNKLSPNKEDFKIKGNNNSSISAYTYKQISGGTKKDVKVVAQTDIDETKSALVNSLKASLQGDIEGLISESEVKLQEDISFGEPQVTTTKKVGEEAETFDITVNLEARLPVITKSDLEKITMELVKRQSDVSGEFEIENFETPTFSGVTLKDKSATFALVSSAEVKPNLDIDEVKESVLGLSTSQAQEKISQLENVEAAKLEYSPNYLPEFLRVLPKDKSRLQVQLLE